MNRADASKRSIIPTAQARRVAIGLFLSIAMSGCVSLESEEGRLPDAMRASISSLSAKGYPDLTKIPDAPTNLPTATSWQGLEAGLVDQGRDLAQNPAASALAPEDTNLEWAKREKAALEADPRAAAMPEIVPGAEGSPEWAAAAKAKFEADLARLPPA